MYKLWLEWLFQRTTAGHLSTGWLAATLAGGTPEAKAKWLLVFSCRLLALFVKSVHVKGEMYGRHLASESFDWETAFFYGGDENPGGTKRTHTERDTPSITPRLASLPSKRSSLQCILTKQERTFCAVSLAAFSCHTSANRTWKWGVMTLTHV